MVKTKYRKSWLHEFTFFSLLGPPDRRLAKVPVIPKTDEPKSKSDVTVLKKNDCTSSFSVATFINNTTNFSPKEKKTPNFGSFSSSSSKTAKKNSSSTASKIRKATDHNSRKEITKLIGASSLTRRKKKEKRKRTYIESDDSDDEYQKKKKRSKKVRIESDSDDDSEEESEKPNLPTGPTVRCTVDLLTKQKSRNGQYRIAALNEKRIDLQDWMDDLEHQNGVCINYLLGQHLKQFIIHIHRDGYWCDSSQKGFPLNWSMTALIP